MKKWMEKEFSQWVYYDDGQLDSKETFVDDIRSGEKCVWYKNGSLKLRVTYVDGQKSGIKYVYYDNNILKSKKGRLIDLVKKKGTNLQRVTYLVFDEADRMFAMVIHFIY